MVVSKSLVRMLVLVAALGSLGAMEVSTQTPVVKVLECLRGNTPKTIAVQDVEIESQGRDVRTPKLGARLYSRREQNRLQTLVHITAPADLAGTRYLILENGADDEVYLYAPALGKVRRVNGYGPEADIGGTSLSATEVRVMLQALRGTSVTMMAPVTVAGREADTLRFVPSVIDSPWRRVLASVDRQTCTVLQAEFQAPQGPGRQYRADPASLQNSGRYWYASVAQIEDHARGARARIALRGVRTDTKLPSRLFDPRSLHRNE